MHRKLNKSNAPFLHLAKVEPNSCFHSLQMHTNVSAGAPGEERRKSDGICRNPWVAWDWADQWDPSGGRVMQGIQGPPPLFTARGAGGVQGCLSVFYRGGRGVNRGLCFKEGVNRG